MVNARNVSGWSLSPSILLGQSPKISYKCGYCGHVNSTRISMEAVNGNKSYVVCAKCGVVNDTKLRYN
jgi:transcription elongation factor Elf1